MNVKLLRKIQKQILKEPRQFDMRHYFETSHTLGIEIPNCGTAACIAGWALAIDGDKTPRDARASQDQGIMFRHPSIAAAKVLRMSLCESSSLFHAGQWPSPFRNRYSKAKTEKTCAKIAADRIGHFIKTGK